MDGYNNFTIEDWLNSEKFQNWIFKNKSNEFWLDYIEQNPSQKENLDQARNILLAIRGDLDIVSPQEVKDRVCDIIDALDTPKNVDSSNYWWKPGWLRVAATFLLIAGLGGVFWKRVIRDAQPYYTNTRSYSSDILDEIVNDTGQPKQVRLPDGSLVVLQSHSRISYLHKFHSDKREVYLLGEAFFDIQKNSKQPFYVYANELVTKVLGTSFNIRAYEEDKEVRVEVKSGRVSVFASNSKEALTNNLSLDGIILTPNQKATFGRKSSEIVRKIVDEPLLLNVPSSNESFSFNRTNAANVFLLLEKSYGVNIDFDEESLSNCTITAELANEPLFEKLNMICAVIESSYESIDGQIIINSKGCK